MVDEETHLDQGPMYSGDFSLTLDKSRFKMPRQFLDIYNERHKKNAESGKRGPGFVGFTKDVEGFDVLELFDPLAVIRHYREIAVNHELGRLDIFPLNKSSRLSLSENILGELDLTDEVRLIAYESDTIEVWNPLMWKEYKRLIQEDFREETIPVLTLSQRDYLERKVVRSNI